MLVRDSKRNAHQQRHARQYQSAEPVRDHAQHHPRVTSVDSVCADRYRTFMNTVRTLLGVPERIYLLMFFLIVLTVADQPMGRLGFLPIPPTVFAIVALAPFLFLALIQDLASRSMRRTLDPLLLNHVPLLAFFVLVIASIGGSILGGAHWDENGKWIFLITYGFALCLCALYLPRGPSYYLLLQNCGVLALLLIEWSIYLDISTPGTFAALTERAAGFSGNANYSALISVMITASILDYADKRGGWFNPLVLALCATIVLSTMSRSGMVCFFALVATFTALRIGSGSQAVSEIRRLVVVAACIIGLGVGAVTVIASTDPIGFKQSRLYRAIYSKRVDDGSAASRLFAVREALKKINESPLLGKGTGYARTLPELPHNLYLQQWVNNGLPGILGYLFFIGASYLTFSRRRFKPGQGLMVVVFVGSFFSHNILDQRTFLILYGSLLAFSARYAKPAIARYSVVA
jgi:O-antigen ligase